MKINKIKIQQNILIIFFLLGYFFAPLKGQIVRSINFTPEDGLPGTEINDIEQDSLGRIWISSRNGIGVFDGIEWKIYDAKNGLLNNSIIQIALDNQGNIWALGNLPNLFLAHFNKNKWRFSGILNKTKISKTSWISGFEILQNDTAKIPVVAVHGDGIFYLRNNNWFNLQVKDGLINNNINSIVKQNNYLYLCTDRGIQVFKDFKLKTLVRFKGLNVLKIVLNQKSGKPLWILTPKALYKVQSNKLRVVAKGFSIGGNVPQFFDISKEYFGLIFFGGYNSLYAFDSFEGKLINYSNKFSRPIGGAYRILVDNEKNLWIAYYYGVAKINSLALQSFGKYSSNYIKVTSIKGLDEKRILIAAKNKIIICYFKKNLFKAYPLTGLKETVIIDSYVDKYGRVWVADVSKGFGIWTRQKGILWFNKINKKNITAFSVTGKGNLIFFLTSDKLFQYNLIDKKLTLILKNKNPASFFRKIFINSRGEVAIVTHGDGLLKSADLKDWKEYRSKTNPILNDDFAYFYDPHLGEFVGSYYGLARVNGDSLLTARLTGKEINSSVYFILKAKNNDLWIGTNRGAYRWHGNSLIHYSTKMGLAGAETNRDAGYVSPDGNVWIGTDAGVTIFNYRFDKLPIAGKPRVIITKIESDNNNYYNFNKGFKINYFNNKLIFHFKTFTQLYPFAIVYKARLLGKDKNWITLKASVDPHLYYSNLSPGKYTFQVKAINIFNTESKLAEISNIIVEKPFYKTWWFVFLISIVVFSIFLFIAFYMSKIKSEELLQEEIEKATIKLKESEEQYKQIFKENKAVLLFVDFETKKIIDANISAVDFYGYTLEELKGKYFSEIDESFNEIYKLIKEKPISTNYRSKHKLSTGEIKSVEVYLSIIHTSQHKYIHIGIHDVTQEEKTKSDLLASEIKYQTIIENIQDGLFMLKDNLIVYVNNAFLLMTGYTAGEVLGKEYLDLIAEEDKNLLKERHAKRMRGENVPNEYVIRLQHKDGSVIITNLHVGIFKLGETTYFVGTLKDITENYRAQQALKESEERYKSLFENNTVGIYRTTPEGKIVLVNQALVEMLGYKNREELIKVNLEAKNIPIVFNRKNFIKQIEKEGIIRGYETKLKRKDGKEIFIRESAKAFKDEKGKTIYYEGVIEDITQVKLAVEELRKSQNRFRSILNSMPDPIIEISPGGIILNIVNSEILEKGLRERIQVGERLENVFAPEWTLQIREAIKSAFVSSGYKALRIEEMLDNSKSYFELRILKVDTNTLLTIVRNITDTIQYQNALIAAKEAAEKSDKLKSEFLAQMSHEIRTPLNSILSFTQLLEEEFYDKVSDDEKTIFDSIKRGSNRLINTIELLIHTAEVQVGSYEPVYQVMDLNRQILQDIIEELRPLAKRKKLELQYIKETQQALIRGDKFSISQIFINLIGNAIKYTIEGSVIIRVYNVEDSFVAVDIKDTGVGISEDFLPHLFEPFSQEEAGYTRKFEGTGLGLSLVKNYIKINSGTISVSSKKGEGTTFTVKFKKNT